MHVHIHIHIPLHACIHTYRMYVFLVNLSNKEYISDGHCERTNMAPYENICDCHLTLNRN